MNEKIFIIDFRGNTNLISFVLRNIKVNIIFLKCLISTIDFACIESGLNSIP